MPLKRLVWLLVPLAAACAAPAAPRWEKSGATEAVVSEAIQDCRIQARLSPPPSRAPVVSSASTTGMVEREKDFVEHEVELFDRCMRAKGFRERR